MARGVNGARSRPAAARTNEPLFRNARRPSVVEAGSRIADLSYTEHVGTSGRLFMPLDPCQPAQQVARSSPSSSAIGATPWMFLSTHSGSLPSGLRGLISGSDCDFFLHLGQFYLRKHLVLA